MNIRSVFEAMDEFLFVAERGSFVVVVAVVV